MVMMRTCDGTDPNLVGWNGAPCDCGLTFDDVELVVIYPHARIPGQAGKDALWGKVQSAVGVPYVWNSGPPTEHGALLHPRPALSDAKED